ncbi:putative TonB-dependent receptor [Alteripontixanthobacter maritimus]|uniref:Putative TonB-dependent receptor n=1 Tax=Alteripontixanthobacter maritimus TaxID=2161824 RepID=A0A369Q238_9SPHN|nr:TonB-dependent receptor [Alteripontixanthobacter maritimus]RDC58963.1 putative TonB-dependent receptor [Alteripontixanthobacter maritimus]
MELEDDVHNQQMDEFGTIIVSAQGLRELNILAGTSVVEGDDLQRELEGQLGDMLEELPGVASSGFAPGASRPVLRGLQGERIRTLIDGIGAIDASNTSADHAVSIDPLTAERIEVLRGPAVLLYGSQAIGGVVNVIDKRIPRRVPNEPVHIDLLAAADSASNLYEGAASIDLPIGNNFVVHADGSYRNSDDIDVGGFTVAPALRAEILAEAAEEQAEGELEEAEELREAAEQRDVLPNSFTETASGNLGFSFIAPGGLIGFSAGIYDTRYGVPGRPGAGHAHGEEEGGEEEGEEEGEERVSIDLRQYRADLLTEVELGDGLFEKLRVRAGYSDYTHTEFEGEEVGTVFDVQGIEARAELVQSRTAPVRGSVGVQYFFRDFAAVGEEAFVAPNRTESFALFALQEVGSGPFEVEFGGRYEKANIDSVPLGLSRDFDTVSGAIGVTYGTPMGLRFGANANYTERAPAAEELFSNGPHIATQAFEIGDPNLAKETALGGEVFVRGNVGIAELSLAAFYTSFDDYIFLSETGEEEDDLPVFVYLQEDANYYGAEGQVVLTFSDTNDLRLATDLRAEYVRAERDDGTDLPRIPPLSLYGALEAGTGPFDARIEAQWFDEQTRTAPFETATDDYTLVGASVSYKPFASRPGLTLIGSVDNIFDVVGRRHTSFTKDFVPIVGRNFRISARASF